MDSLKKRIADMFQDRLTHSHFSPCSLPNAYKRVRKQYWTDRVWDKLETAGLVKIEWPPDDSANLDDLMGDCYDEKLNADSVPGGVRTIRAQKKAFIARVERDGVYGIVGYYRTSPDEKWEHGDSCWGFVGTDDNGYLPDIKSQTIEALRNALRDRCPHCRQPRPCSAKKRGAA